ncbi:penicillin-binding protein [Salipaludibacillus keqinensis]|uniref:serine-type D-Ala-D-Ala carboxypeptidase n=1 Tax=Salipaludibacillus keqinensis TaxID=2045207 RepID=A0A323TXH0_9BACI|nr:penicillin-binding protein 2 [Salipaludibacillus keqinensis]PYZ94295.1 penicillin-binding protein [Salipaludibacillus keqinensis]
MSEKKQLKPHIPIRLNILFFVVFLLFSALILRLGVVQIVQGEGYQEELERTVNISQPVEAPRGLMYDRHGNVLVDNELLFTVTYTNRNTSQDEMIETATRLNEFITMDIEGIEDRFERDRKEFWALINEEEYLEKLSVQEANEQNLSDSEAHLERLDLISEEELNQLTDEELEIFLIWREFNTGYNNLPHKVKRPIEYEEAAKIMEHMEYLPGVDIIRDSARRYTYGDTLSSIFGRVGSIPRNDLNSFLAKGYERNEEVGRSYLEAQYESVLKGRQGELENYMDPNGNFLNNPEQRLGSRGNDLVLTFDMELQQRVKEVIEEEVTSSSARFVEEEDAYVVMMDPHTGEVLAMAGHDSDLGTFTQGYEVGSSMKGATVLAGFDTGAISPGDGVYDRTLKFSGSPDISSIRNLGYVNDLTALERSSNIYMVEIAMRMVGYMYGVSGTNWPDINPGFDTLRSYYNQFGLGVETGIDLPGEFAGVSGGNPTGPGSQGSLLFFSFGQFDTYTTMQLAQYASTIANDGYRIAPRVVKEIREPSTTKGELGALSQQLEPKILNYLDVDEYHLDRIKEGFHRVIHGPEGTARTYFEDRDYNPAGKTGTSQVRINGEDANNQTFAGFAPYDEPEVSIAVIVPGTANEDSAGVANRIVEGSLDAYFELKEERNGPQMPDDGPEVEEVENEISE